MSPNRKSYPHMKEEFAGKAKFPANNAFTAMAANAVAVVLVVVVGSVGYLKRILQTLRGA